MSNVTLLDYTPDELAEMQRLQAEEDAARARIREIDNALFQAEKELIERRVQLRKPDRARVLAEAALSGVEAPPEPPDPPGPALSELEAKARGLQALRKEAEETATVARGAVRALVGEVFRAGAERAAAEYLACARRLAALHAAIGGANEALRQIEGRPNPLIGPDWQDLHVPGSTELEALAGEGKVRGADHLRLPLAGPAELNNQRALEAYEAARTEIRVLLGGRWPFER